MTMSILKNNTATGGDNTYGDTHQMQHLLEVTDVKCDGYWATFRVAMSIANVVHYITERSDMAMMADCVWSDVRSCTLIQADWIVRYIVHRRLNVMYNYLLVINWRFSSNCTNWTTVAMACRLIGMTRYQVATATGTAVVSTKPMIITYVRAQLYSKRWMNRVPTSAPNATRIFCWCIWMVNWTVWQEFGALGVANDLHKVSVFGRDVPDVVCTHQVRCPPISICTGKLYVRNKDWNRGGYGFTDIETSAVPL
jgi:hypothetical protein